MYKELAAELRLFETVYKHSDKPDLADLVGRAANAIEKLQKKYDGAVSDNKSLCRQIAELAKERDEAYSKGLLEGGIAQRAEDEKWMPKWISVTEMLPENIDEEVLVCNSEYGKSGLGLATVAIYDGNGWLECWKRKTYLAAVTHWMPLPSAPEPPKEE